MNRLALHAINSRDVEEVILVVIRDVPFHLRRVHAAVRLRDINGRIAHLRENIDRHSPRGQHRKERDGDERHDYRDWPAKSCEDKAHERLLAGLDQKRLHVAGGGRQSEQRPPDAQMRERIVDFRLREQSLGFGDLIDGGEPRFVTSRGLLRCGARGGHLYGRVHRDLPGAPQLRQRDIPARS